MNELIKKLQDKNYVRAFGLMTVDDRMCFKTVGRDNCEVYCQYDIWSGATCEGFEQSSTYAIKPDYQPEPEFVDIEIRKHRDSQLNEWLGIFDGDSPFELPHDFTHLHCLLSLPNFEGFCKHDNLLDAKDNREEYVFITDIAKLISQGHKVYARFRK